MSESTVKCEAPVFSDLVSSSLSASKPANMAHLPISTMMNLLNPNYHHSLENVFKLQASSASGEQRPVKSVSFTADDIKLIAAEALRISAEQTLSSPAKTTNGSMLAASPQQAEIRTDAPSVAAVLNFSSSFRLNKFVRVLHDMLLAEADSGIVEWRRGLLVLHSTDAFAKTILPKYFNTRNFKTFRRQLNYYGFVHVRSFTTAGASTTALWVNRVLAQSGTDDIGSVLLLRRVEPSEMNKTAEGRRVRKEQAIHTVEDDLGVNQKSLQLEQIRNMAVREAAGPRQETSWNLPSSVPGCGVYIDENASAANLLLQLSRS